MGKNQAKLWIWASVRKENKFYDFLDVCLIWENTWLGHQLRKESWKWAWKRRVNGWRLGRQKLCPPSDLQFDQLTQGLRSSLRLPSRPLAQDALTLIGYWWWLNIKYYMIVYLYILSITIPHIDMKGLGSLVTLTPSWLALVVESSIDFFLPSSGINSHTSPLIQEGKLKGWTQPLEQSMWKYK